MKLFQINIIATLASAPVNTGTDAPVFDSSCLGDDWMFSSSFPRRTSKSWSSI